MDSDEKKFGKGPRELTGAVDLINHYKLLPHHDFFSPSLYPSCQTMYLMMGNVHELYQKRKHEGNEDSADVHKHKKSKVVHCHCFLAGDSEEGASRAETGRAMGVGMAELGTR
uniref:Uncharacterized protein n=1 Tax=Setaria italica TaxID=4555 RepID=K3ZCQ5_SETIT